MVQQPAEAKIVLGPAHGLRFELTWAAPEPDSFDGATWGSLRVSLDDVPIWFGADTESGVHWTWSELLVHLSYVWPYLKLEDGFPYHRTSNDVEALRAEVLFALLKREVAELPAAEQDEAERVLWTFGQRHDLSQAMGGILLDPLWVVRYGQAFEVSSDRVVDFFDAEETLATLEALGDAIAARLEQIAPGLSEQTRDRWARRNEAVHERLNGGVPGLPASWLADAVPEESERARLFAPSRDGWLSEIQAAARMAAPLVARPSAFRAALVAIHDQPHRRTELLDSQSQRVLAELNLEAPRYEQGYAAARALRELLDRKVGLLDLDALLREWGVQVIDVDLIDPEPHALAAWGPSHGPVILLNASSARVSSPRGRRSALAHEIAHLLLDRFDALPLCEVMGGTIRPGVEKRANAFAAELLVPMAAIVAKRNTGAGIEDVVKQLATEYAVSYETIAWHIRNSSIQLDRAEVAYLKTLVTRPDRF